MARLTVEDCVDKVSNRFELVALAAQRAKAINSGGELTIQRGNDKDPVIALREIALGHIKPSILREGLIKRLQLRSSIEAPVEEVAQDETTENDAFGFSETSDLYLGEGEDMQFDQEDYQDIDSSDSDF